MNRRRFLMLGVALAVLMIFVVPVRPVSAATRLYIQSSFSLGFNRIDDLKAMMLLLADDDQDALKALFAGCVRRGTCVKLKRGQLVFEAMRDAPSSHVCAHLVDQPRTERCYWITASAAMPEDMHLDYRPVPGPAIVKYDNLAVFTTPEAAAAGRTARLERGTRDPRAQRNACTKSVDCEIMFSRSQRVVIEMLGGHKSDYACIVGGVQAKCMWTHAAGLMQHK